MLYSTDICLNNAPLFSVLIANYNNGKYLMEAIDSVRRQTYTYWEIILVDDASTDNSKELYKELEKDSRIHIYYNEENRGCGYTKRRCADLANGELCGFLDPDDALTDDALEKHTKVHISRSNVSVVYSKAYFCDTNFNILHKATLPKFSAGETYFDYRFRGSMHFCSYKKASYMETDGINPLLKAGVDQDLYFKIEEVGNAYLLDEFCYYYVVKGHTNAISTNFNNFVNLWYWNMEARRETCIRRGLDMHSIMLTDWKHIFENYRRIFVEMNNEEQIQKLVDSRVDEVAQKKADEVRSSHAYRLGKFLLRPFSFIRHRISK